MNLCVPFISENSYSTIMCLHMGVSERSPLFLPRASLINRYICAKRKCLTLMLLCKQTLQHMHLHTSSRMWLMAHAPINWAVSGWSLSDIPKACGLLCNCSTTTYHKYALTQIFPKVSLTVHTSTISVYTIGSSGHAVTCASTHPGLTSHLKDFCPGKISMKKKKSCPEKPNCIHPKSFPIIIICSHNIQGSDFER